MWLICFGLRGEIGFDWYFRFRLCFGFPGFGFPFGAEEPEPLEFLDGAAVLTLGLGLIAQEEGPGMGFLGHAVEAFAQGEGAVLAARDFDIAIADELGGHQVDGFAFSVEGLVEAGGEEAGLEALGTDEGHLAEGDTFEGEEFLGVDGLVEFDEIVAEVVDFLVVFETDDGGDGAGEAVFTGIEG
jgi:hypothetical protein